MTTPDTASAAPAGTAAGGSVVAGALSTAESITQSVGLALMAGWTMAVLYGALPGDEPGAAPAEPVMIEPGVPHVVTPAHLSTLHELPPAQRRAVELARLRRLLDELAAIRGFDDPGMPIGVPESPVPLEQLRITLMRLNFGIIEALTSFGTEAELAYELGRSLRDTANPPAVPGKPRASLLRQFDRGRVAQLQEWLAVLAEHLPKHSGAVVSASLGRWSEFTAAAIGDRGKPASPLAGRGDLVAQSARLLLRQGDVWLMLLTGTESTAKLLTPEGYVAAGEAAISRSVKIARSVLRKYWLAVIVLLAALGGMLYLAFAFTSGAATAWTSIASITGTIGFSGAGTMSVIGRLGEEAALPVFAPAEEDAMAWTITTLPQASLSARKVRQLRKAGVPRSSGLGHI